MARMTTTTNANTLQDVFLYKTFIAALHKTLAVAGLGTHEDVRHSTGKTCRWQYFANPSAFTTALTEGADPTSPSDLATTAITAAVLEYGMYYDVSKMLQSTGASGTMQEIVSAAGYAGSLTLDTLAYTLALQDCTNTNDSTTTLVASVIKLSAQELVSNNAQHHPDSTGGAYFILVLSPEQAYDMMGETRDFSTAQTPTWADIHQTDSGIRGASGQPFKGPANIIYGCEIRMSSNVQVAAAEDLGYLIAKDAFGSISLDSDIMDPRVIVTSPEQRVDKPLRNAGTVGVWLCAAFELIDSNRVVEIKSDVT